MPQPAIFVTPCMTDLFDSPLLTDKFGKAALGPGHSAAVKPLLAVKNAWLQWRPVTLRLYFSETQVS